MIVLIREACPGQSTRTISKPESKIMITELPHIQCKVTQGEAEAFFNFAQFFTPQLAGEAHQLGCPKIVLDQCVYIYIYINYVCAHHNA